MMLNIKHTNLRINLTNDVNKNKLGIILVKVFGMKQNRSVKHTQQD